MDIQTQQLSRIAAPLLAWYDANRRDLPWRHAPSPYRVWVSEIMLQQTRVEAVRPYFASFMDAFPTVEALANAPEEQLLRLWQGLGYYSRARNLQRAAQTVCRDYGGALPEDYDALRTLPGIGDYTAGAILSIACAQRVPAVDGNVLRIAARLLDDGQNVLSAGVRTQYRAWLAEALPPSRCGDYNQALMDLGATVCLPKGAAKCDACPLSPLCAAQKAGTQALRPLREKKKDKRVEQLTVFVLCRPDGTAALRQRPDKGLLASLWEYPHVDGTLDEAQAAQVLADWGLTPHRWYQKLTARHEFTHIRWEMTGYVLEVAGTGALAWYTPRQRQSRAIPSAFKKFTESLGEIDNGTAVF